MKFINNNFLSRPLLCICLLFAYSLFSFSKPNENSVLRRQIDSISQSISQQNINFERGIDYKLELLKLNVKKDVDNSNLFTTFIIGFLTLIATVLGLFGIFSIWRIDVSAKHQIRDLSAQNTALKNQLTLLGSEVIETTSKNLQTIREEFNSNLHDSIRLLKVEIDSNVNKIRSEIKQNVNEEYYDIARHLMGEAFKEGYYFNSIDKQNFSLALIYLNILQKNGFAPVKNVIRHMAVCFLNLKKNQQAIEYLKKFQSLLGENDLSQKTEINEMINKLQD